MGCEGGEGRVRWPMLHLAIRIFPPRVFVFFLYFVLGGGGGGVVVVDN